MLPHWLENTLPVDFRRTGLNQDPILIIRQVQSWVYNLRRDVHKLKNSPFSHNDFQWLDCEIFCLTQNAQKILPRLSRLYTVTVLLPRCMDCIYSNKTFFDSRCKLRWTWNWDWFRARMLRCVRRRIIHYCHDYVTCHKLVTCNNNRIGYFQN